MRVFVTGASGHIGGAVITELLDNGHSVVGLARSDASASAVESAGAEVWRGDLDDLSGLADAARASDGVVHLAFKHDLLYSGDMEGAVAAELLAIEAMCDALANSGKPFVHTSTTAQLAFFGGLDRPGLESDAPEGPARVASENAALAWAAQGVRASAVRLPPCVHSALDTQGFIPALIGLARATGVVGYVGDGGNRWPAVNTLDAARLYRLALENGSAGSRYHATDEGAIAFRAIAEALATHLGLSTRSIDPAAAADHFGILAGFVSMDNPVSSGWTRDQLAWKPEQPGLLEDLEQPHYWSH